LGRVAGDTGEAGESQFHVRKRGLKGIELREWRTFVRFQEESPPALCLYIQ
jgi:hypothetical protein